MDALRHQGIASTKNGFEAGQNGTHMEWVVDNVSCRRAMLENLQRYRRRKLLEATWSEEVRSDLRELTTPLSTLLSGKGLSGLPVVASWDSIMDTVSRIIAVRRKTIPPALSFSYSSTTRRHPTKM